MNLTLIYIWLKNNNNNTTLWIYRFIRLHSIRVLWQKLKTFLEIFWPKDTIKYNSKYETGVFETTEEVPRWMTCLDLINLGNLSLAISSAYIRKHFNKDDYNKTLELVKDIENEMLNILSSTDWLDETTK